MSKGQNILKDIFVTGSDEIAQGQIINAWHVSQSVVALTGAENYDISVSGSFTVSGSIYQEDPYKRFLPHQAQRYLQHCS
jgi:hypothetical protein